MLSLTQVGAFKTERGFGQVHNKSTYGVTEAKN